MTFETPDEADRLRVLHSYQILDTPPEEAFDRITSLVSRIFSMPMVLVSLVDMDRQWFKSCFGVDIRETSRELSFCARAILSDDVMVVPNMLQDPRFSEHPFVKQHPDIRFYAGAPLKVASGQKLGTLCVLDTVPREFNSQESAILAQFADLVVDELDLRRTGREIRDREAQVNRLLAKNSQLAAAVQNLTVGTLITDPTLPDNPIIFVNPAFCEMTGYSADEMVGWNCRFLQGPDSDPAKVQAIREALAEKRHFSDILLNYHKDGSPFLSELFISPIFDDNGELINFVGLQTDVTERERAREELAQARFSAEEANKVLEQRVRERTKDLAESQIEILKRLASAAELRDDDTGQHTQRVARTAALLARGLGWHGKQVTRIQQAAPLHDVGKIAIPDNVLLKTGRLTADEFELMKTHAAQGAALLAGGRSDTMRMAEVIARSHHERWDGCGYPSMLIGDAIPIEGRVVAVADVFDALTHERPYKPAWPVGQAVAEIVAQSGKQFDPTIVEAFLKLPAERLV